MLNSLSQKLHPKCLSLKPTSTPSLNPKGFRLVTLVSHRYRSECQVPDATYNKLPVTVTIVSAAAASVDTLVLRIMLNAVLAMIMLCSQYQRCVHGLLISAVACSP